MFSFHREVAVTLEYTTDYNVTELEEKELLPDNDGTGGIFGQIEEAQNRIAKGDGFPLPTDIQVNEEATERGNDVERGEGQCRKKIIAFF